MYTFPDAHERFDHRVVNKHYVQGVSQEKAVLAMKRTNKLVVRTVEGRAGSHRARLNVIVLRQRGSVGRGHNVTAVRQYVRRLQMVCRRLEGGGKAVQAESARVYGDLRVVWRVLVLERALEDASEGHIGPAL